MFAHRTQTLFEHQARVVGVYVFRLFKLFFISYSSMKGTEMDFHERFFSHSNLVKSIWEYVNLKSTDYALLLSGEWGTGKTFLIRQIIEGANKVEKQINYISLNGISTKEELYELIFVTNSPMDKFLKLGGRFVHCISAAVSMGIFNISFKPSEKEKNETKIEDFAKRKRETPIVFDDIERCNIPFEELLGVFSFLLEEWQIPLILIGNESFLTNKLYRERKEKVIGRTLVLHADGDYIIRNSFITNQWPFKKELTKIISNIFSKFFEVFNKENLRAFKMALRETLFILNYVNEDLKENIEFVKVFVEILVVSKYAIQLGLFCTDDDTSIGEEKMASSRLVEILKKVGIHPYKPYSLELLFFSVDEWMNLLSGEPFDWVRGNTLISRSHFFIKKIKKTWEYLYASDHYDDDIVNSHKEMLLEEIKEYKYKNLEEIMMVFNMLEKEYEKEFYIAEQLKKEILQSRETRREELISQFKAYIEKLLCTKELTIENYNELLHYPDCYSGYRFFYTNNEDSFYTYTKAYVKNVIIKIKKMERRKEQDNILESLKNGNFASFLDYIKPYNEEKGNFLFTSDFISSNNFLDILKKATVENLRDLNEKLIDRYEHNEKKQLLDKLWLQYERPIIEEILNLLYRYCQTLGDEKQNRVFILLHIYNTLKTLLEIINEQKPLPNLCQGDLPLTLFFLKNKALVNLAYDE